MKTKSLIAGTLGLAVLLGGMVLLMDGHEATDSASPTPNSQPQVTANAGDAPPAPRPSSGGMPAAPGDVAPDQLIVIEGAEHRDYAEYFHRPYVVERVCDGKKGAALADGRSIMLESCRTVDKNPSPYRDDSTEQLLADIEAGQPWAVDAMEVLGMRYFENGFVQAGAGWLKEHAARTGKVGLLHIAQANYLGGSVEHELVRYEFMGILIAKRYPVYAQKMLEAQRGSLLGAGVQTAQLDAIDASVQAFVGQLTRSAPGTPDAGGAS